MGGVDAGRWALFDLVEPTRWQLLQDHFVSALGIPLRTVSPSHELLTTPSWPSALHAERVVSGLRVGEELQVLLPLTAPPHETTSMTTAAGVTYASVPIRVTDGGIVAYFVVGPLVVGRRDDEGQFRQRLSATDLNAETLWPLVLLLKLYTFGGIRSVLNLLEEVGATLVQLAYQVRQLATILPPSSPVDQVVVIYYTDRVLHSLLEVATQATKAEGGSVMLYDAASDSYRIVASEGLSGEIIRTTRVKRGEGLAGHAAQVGQILLIDERMEDPELKSRMQRPGLASSIVVPLTLESSSPPLGILNLRTSNRTLLFTAGHLDLLNKLTQLAQTALASLKLLTTSFRPPR